MKKSFKKTITSVAAVSICAILFTVGCKKVPIVNPGPHQKDSLFAVTLAYCSSTATSCDGSATVNVKGGTAPYQYDWSGGQTTKSISGLCPGTYTLTVMDVSGKTTTGSATIVVCLNPKDSIPQVYIKSTCSVIDTSGNCTGKAIPVVAGGKTPYTFQWSNGQTTAVATGLCPGTYSLTVTDASGKTAANSVTVQSCPIPPLYVKICSSCNSDTTNCNGTANAVATGGVYPYTFSWSNGDTTKNIKGLCAGTYTVTVTDANGSTSTKATTVYRCHKHH